MCYTLKDSIISFIVNIISCYILYTYSIKNKNIERELKIISLFFYLLG